jgi:hypothetical protein
MFHIKIKLKLFLLIIITSVVCLALFLYNFDVKKKHDWFWFTGDGYATMDFVQMDGFARICVDATKDKDNVYWTLIKRDVTSSLDLSKLKDTTYQLRVEAKVRVHDAPRRVNFMVNTNRTIDYDVDLMEYDIPDTTDWHVISMTTKKFDAHPGDTVYVQMCVTDYGIGKYYVDIDYYRADIVNVNTTGPDKGDLVPYHPPIPDVNTFSNHLGVDQDCIINSDFPDVNFNDWHVKEKDGDARILTVNINQWAILKWNLEKYKNLKADGPAILEITTQSVPKGGGYIKTFGEDFGIEFGKVKVIEIFGGDSAWDQNNVTYNNFIKGKAYKDVFNEQTIYDVDLSEAPGSKSFITISQPVFQRMLDGKTKGLLIRQLGAMDASIYASENQGNNGPKLHFNIKR